ncbi:DNA cytosine methyltransferase [Bradyrhizobium sp. IC3195]|uniref:DNA cytosine methyltransferase n=1 Tax=Bradyrhizobium sp. IC3195 TaxID=2793804 RepID=UPI001CD7C407|nr:DNA cytosine methyltransferase [Bradyrhizobium sp. IC3195]MCA1469631.1 DNA cytosine methyltransferase [Bradyrhizobium sp. IC3195]
MKKRVRRKSLESVDLFCGAGGLSYGLSLEGIAIRAGFDLDPACEWPYERNVSAPFHCRDVEHLKASEVASQFSRRAVRLLAGCAPCQKFSSYTQKKSSGDRNRWRLLESFRRIAVEVSPELITMENVPGLARHQRFEAFVKALKLAGYSVWYDVVECAKYGMPQSRKRLVVLASKLGSIEIVSPQNFAGKDLTVEDAISHLPAIRAGEAHRSDSLHRSSALSDENMRRIRASRQAGTWRDWPKDLVLPCHKKKSGSGYPSIYGRMSWSEKAPTITTLAYNYGSGRFGHPSQDRAISLREAALLQTFPSDYAFVPPGSAINVRVVGRLIGNAVPVTLARVIGRSVVAHIENASTP